MNQFIHKNTQITSSFSPSLYIMKITISSKPTNPTKFIWTSTACHFRTTTTFLNQYLAIGAISNPITSICFCPLTQFINFFTRSTFSMIILLAFSTHLMITYITPYLSTLYPRTEYTSKATANKREKSTKTIIGGATVLPKFSFTSLINFM